MKVIRTILILSVAGILAGFTFSQGRNQQQRGGPPGVFSTSVPEYELSIIQSNPTSNSVDLSIMAPKDQSVTLQLPNGQSKALTLTAFVPQTVKVDGLTVNEDYSYTAQVDGKTISGTIATRKSPGNSFTFAIQADSHLDENTSASSYLTTLNQIANDKPDFLIDLGDTFMNDKRSNFRDSMDQYRAQRYYLGIPGKSASIFLALGNHDGEQGWTDRNKDGMSEWSATQRNLFFPPPANTGNTKTANYYEFTWGDAHCIILDPFSATTEKPARTENNWIWTLGETQYKWLTKTLENSTSKYKFIFIHHLVGGQGKDTRGGAEASHFFEWGGKNLDGTDGFSANRPGWDLPLHDLFKKFKVDVVFRGHDHLYVKQDRDGLVYQLVPQPSSAREGSTRSAEGYGYHSGTILSSPGYLRVRISPETASVEYVKTSGASPVIADRYEIKS